MTRDKPLTEQYKEDKNRENRPVIVVVVVVVVDVIITLTIWFTMREIQENVTEI